MQMAFSRRMCSDRCEVKHPVADPGDVQRRLLCPRWQVKTTEAKARCRLFTVRFVEL